MEARLRHIGVVSEHVERSVRFYGELGFRVISDQWETGDFVSKILGRESARVRTVKMSNGEFTIELLDFGEDKIERDVTLTSVGLTHLALTVPTADEIYDKLCELGAFPISRPRISVCGTARVFFVRDPNNAMYFEIVEEISR